MAQPVEQRYQRSMDGHFSSSSISAQTLTRTHIERLISTAPSHLIDCEFEDLDLGRLDLSGWTFERCNLRRTDFTGSRLERSVWRSCRAAFAMFVGADLSDASFVASDLSIASLRRSTLGATTFERCKLTGADLSEAKAFDTRFTETLLINAKLPGYSFRNQTLHKLDLGQADRRKCDLRGTVFEDCSLRDAHMAGSRFQCTDLRGPDLGGLRLSTPACSVARRSPASRRTSS